MTIALPYFISEGDPQDKDKIQANFEALSNPRWISYTPTGPTNTTLTGRYCTIGNVVVCNIKGVCTGTPNWTNMPTLPITAGASLLPNPSAASINICGSGGYIDAGTANRPGGVGPIVAPSATTVRIINMDSAGDRGNVSTTAPITWATNDEWYLYFMYEI